jgi:TatD DNase family protein
LEIFDRYLPDTRYVGEIGLDGSPEFRQYWGDQLAVFKHILSRCREAGGRIMSIHSRRASGPVLDCLEENDDAGVGVLHWFSGSLRDLDRAVKLGCWFSVGPTMLAGEKGRQLVARMPRERVLTESDGPFAQLDGVAVMPWQVANAVEMLGQTWSLTPEEVDQTVRRNLKDILAKHGGTKPELV